MASNKPFATACIEAEIGSNGADWRNKGIIVDIALSGRRKLYQNLEPTVFVASGLVHGEKGIYIYIYVNIYIGNPWRFSTYQALLLVDYFCR